MRWQKKVLVAMLVLVVMIQFIQPRRNKTEEILPTDLTNTFTVTINIQAILKKACYDCHSNNTNYPWYSYVQPFGWFLARHIKRGKAELNLSEFGSYPIRRQISKLKGMTNSLRNGDMPLKSYKLLHPEARLSEGEEKLLMEWLEKTRDDKNRSIR